MSDYDNVKLGDILTEEEIQRRNTEIYNNSLRWNATTGTIEQVTNGGGGTGGSTDVSLLNKEATQQQILTATTVISNTLIGTAPKKIIIAQINATTTPTNIGNFLGGSVAKTLLLSWTGAGNISLEQDGITVQIVGNAISLGANDYSTLQILSSSTNLVTLIVEVN